MDLPISYTCQGTDALGPNETGPYGEVINREGQLWIEEIT
jgi:hypothetical protein